MGAASAPMVAKSAFSAQTRRPVGPHHPAAPLPIRRSG
jgi:hypothetical protein